MTNADFNGALTLAEQLRMCADFNTLTKLLLTAADRLDLAAKIAARQKERIAELESSRDWMPISTAPKDGTEVFLFAPIGDKAVCYWSDKMDGWTWGLGKYFNIPTHWMPLPESPSRGVPDGN